MMKNIQIVSNVNKLMWGILNPNVFFLPLVVHVLLIHVLLIDAMTCNV